MVKRKRFSAGRLLDAVQRYALECLEHEDFHSLYRFCEQFGEIMQSIEAEHEAFLAD